MQPALNAVARSREKLATLVKTRTETLSLYTELANQRPFEADDVTNEALQEFCQALIDYAASAHFQLYRFISDKLERRTPVIEIADRVYPTDYPDNGHDPALQ